MIGNTLRQSTFLSYKKELAAASSSEYRFLRKHCLLVSDCCLRRRESRDRDADR